VYQFLRAQAQVALRTSLWSSLSLSSFTVQIETHYEPYGQRQTSFRYPKAQHLLKCDNRITEFIRCVGRSDQSIPPTLIIPLSGVLGWIPFHHLTQSHPQCVVHPKRVTSTSQCNRNSLVAYQAIPRLVKSTSRCLPAVALDLHLRIPWRLSSRQLRSP